MSIPTDKDLYDRIKQRVYKEIPKHSAYRSGHLVKEYKHAFQKKHGKGKSPYKGTKKEDKGLSLWFKQSWRNEKGGVGYTKDATLYRPTKKVKGSKIATWNELTKKEIEDAKREKKKTGRVKSFKKK